MPPHASPAAPGATGIPPHLTRFVGRERELQELVRLMERTRLLTLTGAGGSGKTRLAGEVASRAAGRFERVAWADLSPVTNAELLVQQVAAALQAPERSDLSPRELLVRAVCGQRVLLVLDNCEHVVDACAELVAMLLQSCPRVVILATSREALGVGSEMAWLVPPLASAEAMQLFVERAQAALPSFGLSDANAGAVAEICRRLDGIPLAIELAAARVRVLPPEQIAARLDDAFRLLTGGSRTALPRHRTLRAAIDWSYELLSSRERTLLARLAVFAGSFTLEAAEMVCASDSLEEEDILDGVSALVDRSLLVMESCDGVARYRMLETVRQYGLERLTGTGARERFELRFATYLVEMVEEVAPSLVGGSNAPPLLAGLVAERDNIRAAAAWAVADASRAELGLRFVGALFWFWYATAQFREARQLTDRALALGDGAEGRLRGRALVTSALTALAQGEHARSAADFEAAIPMLRAAGDHAEAASALAKYGAARLLGGNVTGAIEILDEALEITRELPVHDVAAVFARFWRGWAAYAEGELDRARELLVANVEAGRTWQLLTTLAHALATLARIELARGEVEQACALALEALELELEIADAWGTGIALDVVVLAAAQRGRPEVAARLLGGVDAHRERHGVAVPEAAPGERAALCVRLRDALGSRFDVLRAEGQGMSLERTAELALAEAARHTTEHRVPQPARASGIVPGTPMLRVSSLGPLQVFVGDAPVPASAWGSARARELLVYLLVHPEGRTREQVGLAFWPDASAAQLRNSFHVALHRLRKALGGAQWVTIAGDRYRVDPALVQSFDAELFSHELSAARRAVARGEEGGAAQLEHALARYGGDFLDGEPFGDWHLEHRDRLQREYVDGLMALGAQLTREERHARAAEAYRRVLARDELHEEALVALMRCLAEAGERPQAMRAYQRFAEQLRRELEAEPAPEATRLFQRLQGTERVGRV